MSFSFFPLVSKCSSVALAVSLDTLLTQMLWAGEAGPSGGEQMLLRECVPSEPSFPNKQRTSLKRVL